MRLLNVVTLEFTTFSNKNKPKYAIASHRWHDGLEATYKSFEKNRDTDRAGHRKIVAFARYVSSRVPGVEWLWLDTCCIDQRSSAEVSEAINSMFQWYRNAEVCLAYLHDVSAADGLASFERSDWFLRGWTLQELLAPDLVVFLDREWVVLGHKGHAATDGSFDAGPILTNQIAAITRIPEPILRDYSESWSLTVDEKLEWATQRQTTREEDITYCLLGILDVSMNIRYGDGKEKTRARLMKKLRSTRSSTPSDWSVVDADTSDDFITRDASPSGSSHIIESHDPHRYTEVVWRGSTNLDSLATELVELARRLKVSITKLHCTPRLLQDIASELETFAQAVYGIEKDQHISAPDLHNRLMLQRCATIFTQATQRIHDAIVNLEQHSIHSRAGDGEEVQRFCDEALSAKVSLTFGYQLYVDARRRLDTELLRRMLSRHEPDNGYNHYPDHESQQGQISARGPRQSLTSNRHSSSSRPRTFHASAITHNTRRPKWRLRLSPWFTSRVWELNLSFSTNLRASNLVPGNSLIFAACRAGDIAEVQSLFAQNKASPYDYCRGATVLMEAASSGNIQLCRYLIDLAGFPVATNNWSDPLTEYVCSRNYVEDQTENDLDMHRLLLSDPDGQYDLAKLAYDDGAHPWWWACPSPSCLSMIKENSVTAINELPWNVQVRLAIDNGGHRTSSLPSMFLQMLGCTAVDSRIANAQDDQGRTALHMMAAETAWEHKFERGLNTTWPDFLKDLLAAGADLHQKRNDGLTPLMGSLVPRLVHSTRGPTSIIRRWITLLDRVGIDLLEYGRLEAPLFAASHPEGLSFRHCRVTSFKFGPRVEDWSAQESALVHIYKLDCPPGTWSIGHEHRPKTIIWQPEHEEYADMWPWKEAGQLSLARSTLNKDNNATSDPIFSYTPRTAGLAGTQDDCRGMMLLVQREIRPASRPRSFSEPAQDRAALDLGEYEDVRAWVPGYHICRFDRKPSFGWPDGLGSGWVATTTRRCVKGSLDFNPDRLWSAQGGITELMYRWRRETFAAG